MFKLHYWICLRRLKNVGFWREFLINTLVFINYKPKKCAPFVSIFKNFLPKYNKLSIKTILIKILLMLEIVMKTLKTFLLVGVFGLGRGLLVIIFESSDSAFFRERGFFFWLAPLPDAESETNKISFNFA